MQWADVGCGCPVDTSEYAVFRSTDRAGKRDSFVTTAQYFYKIVEDDAHIVPKTALFYLQGNNGVPYNVNLICTLKVRQLLEVHIFMAKKGQKQKKYSGEFKIDVIMDMREHHMGYCETAKKVWIGRS